MRRTVPPTACASARSIASGFQYPDSLRSDDADVRKPCAVIWSFGNPIRRSEAFSVLSLMGRDRVRTEGKTYWPEPERIRMSARIASACRERGTACGWRIFILPSGIVQTALSKSISLHSIWRISPGRWNKCGVSFKAAITAGSP